MHGSTPVPFCFGLRAATFRGHKQQCNPASQASQTGHCTCLLAPHWLELLWEQKRDFFCPDHSPEQDALREKLLEIGCAGIILVWLV
jgi:hypothetical protein